jgi:hypothetical protein
LPKGTFYFLAGFGGGERTVSVDYVWVVARDIIQTCCMGGGDGLEGVEIGDGGGIIGDGSVVYAVGIEGEVLEGGEAFVKDGSLSGHEDQEGNTSVSEVVGEEHLLSGTRCRAWTDKVPDILVEDGLFGRIDTEVGRCKYSKVLGIVSMEIPGARHVTIPPAYISQTSRSHITSRRDTWLLNLPESIRLH